MIWSVAEGSRGRRWRWMVRTLQAFVERVGLVELGPSGDVRRLELEMYGGLLTFHPEPGGQLAHGNIVSQDGVSPIATIWQPGWSVGFVGDPFGSAVCGWAGEGLVVTSHRDSIVWREPGRHADVTALPVDPHGVPILERGSSWPLEEDA